ncbi:acyl carrier protein [Streptomyces sp. OF3]|uniref:Acyl carrier protein n=1 Tax=Streptomyces alkaliterrae TaxID=2213162 RepID=A0A7W3WH71_9ACTN|nr:phosphopantetheine-binding protein [Streptomyces alkaliterrae]MBB1252303.1 acyl carrier protein [Streptomyces alkaliterrae]
MNPAPRQRPPESEITRVVAEIWCEVLGVSEVAVDDNFFDLGGHSVLLQMVQDRLARRTGKSVELIDLFNHPTVRSLARHLDGEEGNVPGGARNRSAGRVNRLGNRRARLGANEPRTRGTQP